MPNLTPAQKNSYPGLVAALTTNTPHSLKDLLEVYDGALTDEGCILHPYVRFMRAAGFGDDEPAIRLTEGSIEGNDWKSCGFPVVKQSEGSVVLTIAGKLHTLTFVTVSTTDAEGDTVETPVYKLGNLSLTVEMISREDNPAVATGVALVWRDKTLAMPVSYRIPCAMPGSSDESELSKAVYAAYTQLCEGKGDKLGKAALGLGRHLREVSTPGLYRVREVRTAKAAANNLAVGRLTLILDWNNLGSYGDYVTNGQFEGDFDPLEGEYRLSMIDPGEILYTAVRSKPTYIVISPYKGLWRATDGVEHVVVSSSAPFFKPSDLEKTVFDLVDKAVGQERVCTAGWSEYPLPQLGVGDAAIPELKTLPAELEAGLSSVVPLPTARTRQKQGTTGVVHKSSGPITSDGTDNEFDDIPF